MFDRNLQYLLDKISDKEECLVTFAIQRHLVD